MTDGIEIVAFFGLSGNYLAETHHVDFSLPHYCQFVTLVWHMSFIKYSLPPLRLYGKKRGTSSFSKVVLAVRIVSSLCCFRGNFVCSFLLFRMCWGCLLHPTQLLSSSKDKLSSNTMKLPLHLWKTPFCPPPLES